MLSKMILHQEANFYLDTSDRALRATILICLPVEYPCLLQDISQIDVSIQKIWVKCYSLKIFLRLTGFEHQQKNISYET